jgi:DNA-binding transcriptional LysR family regulator
MDIDPALIRALAAVKQTGGFTAAAARLNLTQSAISHQIRRLERLVGLSLVERTTRDVLLTEEGEAFLTCGHRVLNALDDLNRRFCRQQLRGVVRLGVPDNFLGNELPEFLARFGARFPDIQLTVSVGMSLNLKELVAVGELDLAVVMDVGGTCEGALRIEQLVWAAAGLFRHDRHSLPLALFPSPCTNREAALEALTNHGVAWHLAVSSSSPEGILAAVRSGLAVTVLGKTELKAGLRDVGEDLGLPSLPNGAFRLVCSPGQPSDAVRQLQLLIQECAPA